MSNTQIVHKRTLILFQHQFHFPVLALCIIIIKYVIFAVHYYLFIILFVLLFVRHLNWKMWRMPERDCPQCLRRPFCPRGLLVQLQVQCLALQDLLLGKEMPRQVDVSLLTLQCGNSYFVTIFQKLSQLTTLYTE